MRTPITVGQKFGHLVLLRLKSEQDSKRCLTRCDCGKEHLALLYNLTSGKTTSCGCMRAKKAILEINHTYSNHKYGQLTFIKHACRWAGLKKGKVPIALWKCDCGSEKEIRLQDVVRGSVKSCGCIGGVDGGTSKVGKTWNKLTLLSVETALRSNIGTFSCACGGTIKTKLTSVKTGRTKSCGCIRSEVQRKTRGFVLDETKFETITDESAYWLGFLMADGNVSRNTITVNLKSSDMAHLEKFRFFMGGNQKISIKKDTRVSGYAFGSIKVTSDLAKYGIIPNKSYIAKAPEELKNNPHFWRGMVDGDGSVGHSHVALCGTKDICEAFLNFAKNVIDTDATVQKCNENLYHTRIGVSRFKSSKLLRLIYNDAPVYLDRKYAKAMDIIKRVDSRT